MTQLFDTPVDRRGYSIKWDLVPPDVLPLWVADMDFRSPEPVIRALRDRVAQGTFGYHFDSLPLRETLAERMQTRYGWQIVPGDVFFMPGLVVALNVVCRLTGEPGSSVIMHTPVYHPFLGAPLNNGQTVISSELLRRRANGSIHYTIDFDAFEGAITPQTRLFLLCNPHNPVGRSWTRAELERLAEICLRHNLYICSDEIHCDLLLDEQAHIPIASLSPEVAARTITLMAPSKTFNLPGLGLGFAIIQDAELMKKLQGLLFTQHLFPPVNTLAYSAALAAYREGQAWLDALLPYLRANRDTLVAYVHQHMPRVALTCPEATYLAWLDLSESGIPSSAQMMPGSSQTFFWNEARVAVQEGRIFGQGGEPFVRLNFGCTRATLLEALERMRAALDRHNLL
ncbi:MAG: putative C-S lyase [Chloroflexi bacterium]|nr:putative C-S lyase [Chloroflexota bacterium]